MSKVSSSKGSQQRGTILRDQMDDNRLIEIPPNSDVKSPTILCRIFYEGRGYVGKAPVPRACLDKWHFDRGIGFESPDLRWEREQRELEERARRSEYRY